MSELPTNLKGFAHVYERAHINTDEIIPARYLNVHEEAELARHAMEDIDTSFVKRVKPGDVVVAGDNFGCGSSREHAVWALSDYGIRAVVAPSFGDIFFNNSFQNGLLPVMLPAERVAALRTALEQSPGSHVAIDLEAQTVTAPDGAIDRFELDPFRKECLLAGTDDISFTLGHCDRIAEFEKAYEARIRWL
jgi:3-isopropylmalate/(R)-2-methylmalate dehydratase small subunit